MERCTLILFILLWSQHSTAFQVKRPLANDTSGLVVGIGTQQDGRYYCSNFLNGNIPQQQLYNSSEAIKITDPHNVVHFCLSAAFDPVKVSIYMEIDTKHSHSIRILVPHMMSALATYGFGQITAESCGGYLNDCPKTMVSAQIECAEEGTFPIWGDITEVMNGTKFPFQLKITCPSSRPWSSADYYHILIAIPLFIAANIHLFRHLGIGQVISSPSSQKRLAKSTASPLFRPLVTVWNLFSLFWNYHLLLFVVGVIITISIASFSVNHDLVSNTPMFIQLNLGLLFIGTSLLSLLFRKNMMSDSINFTTPLLVICIGVVYFFMDAMDHFTMFIYQMFGILCICTAILGSVAEFYPKFKLLFILSAMFTPLVFMCAAPRMNASAQFHNIMAPNFVFVVANITAGWFVTCTAIFKLIERCTGRKSMRTDEEELTELSKA
eukprot:TRINITY_DN15224_c0_g1_i1.p1 TRINITY_DN15224_c0_g1~~TRINITY_DN15224_c0_g1_i1.p1  ORF type:complete len:438 (+),score=79.68 TRINITY_DN15224_c0_g1_i1:60-1373(+)